VKATVHNANNASTPNTGCFATLSAFLRFAGSTAPSLRPRGRSLLLAAAVAVAAAALAAVVALAVNPIHIEARPSEEHIFSTRAIIEMAVADSENVPVEWRAEVAPALENGEAPPPPKTPGEAPWAPAGGSVEPVLTHGELLRIALGYEGVPNEPDFVTGVLHHLHPETAYYARFVAAGGSEEAHQSVKFETPAIAKPELFVGFTGERRPFQADPTSRTSARAKAHVESNGAQTTYHFEYSLPEEGHAPRPTSPSWKPFTAGGEGLITVPADFADLEAQVTGLTPETTYYTRVKAINEKGTSEEEEVIATPTAKAVVALAPDVRNVTGTAAHLTASLVPNGSETHWRFQYTTEPANPASWVTVPGAEGTVSQAEAEALDEAKAHGGRSAVILEAGLTGLHPSTAYSVRLFAENVCASFCGGGPSKAQGFETSGPPSVTTFAVHGLHGESLRLLGSVNPDSLPTSEEQTVTLEGAPTGGTFTLTFNGQTTAPIAFNAPGEAVGRALLAAHIQVSVNGPAGGPYTVYFLGSLGERSEPLLEAASSLTPSGAVNVTVTQLGGLAYDTHYHFEYVSEEDFKAGGWAKATSTPAVDVGHSRPPAETQGTGTLDGTETDYVGADLPPLTPGESYRYRISAVNTSPGEHVVLGEERALVVPALGPAQPPAACPNSATRTGLSGRLADCRAYEQLTPVDKGGAQEIFNYAGNVGQEGATPGSDGERLEYGSTAVKWGSVPDAGQSPYFFSRGGSGWQLTAATAQPEAGVDTYSPQVLAPDLSALGLEARFATSPASQSSHVEFKTGPPGGPYAVLPPVPVAQATPGWVGSSADLSKLVLQVEDHTLLGHPTHTAQGDDLYEYAGGALRQANVDSTGTTIGACGATIAGVIGTLDLRVGVEQVREIAANRPVSADGQRVFFEAVPTASCSEPRHTYVRVDGGGEAAQTLDLGVYRFLAANSDGSSVLLEKPTGENPGLYLYTAESGNVQFLPASGVAINQEGSHEDLVVSADLSTVYIRSGGEGDQTLYRYDVPSRRLLLVTHFAALVGRSFYSASPDGRYFYLMAGTVAGLPGGGQELETPHSVHAGQTAQVYRYDSAESLIQCMSCASAFDPEPRLSALFTRPSEGGPRIAAENGDYVFFDTPAALLRSDVDGEIAPEGIRDIEGVEGEPGEHSSDSYSVSSDVYEWRRYGLDGCSHVQGCLGLITSGRGGFENILLGTTSSGRDVFFATHESLLTADNDTASDIYDARIGGGFPEPASPVECNGDACALSVAPPSDLTPSSATFQGVGNVLASPLPGVSPQPKPKPKPKARCKSKRKSKRKCRAKKKTARKARRAERQPSANGRVGR
jgi:hypothetical protein